MVRIEFCTWSYSTCDKSRLNPGFCSFADYTQVLKKIKNIPKKWLIIIKQILWMIEMVQFAKPPNGPRNDYGRINILIEHELGQYQNIIQKWIANLEDNAKHSPSNISQFKFGKILGYLLLQSLKKANLHPDNFRSFGSDPWEEPHYQSARIAGKYVVTQDTYRIYFSIPGADRADKEKINAHKEQAQIHHFTTMTNDGLMVFSFEDKVEKIEPELFVELAKNIEVNSEAWSQFIQFAEENFRHSGDNELNAKIPQILGLILHESIVPEHRDDIFNNLCSLLIKSEKPAFNSITTRLLKDIIPDYETKVMAFLHKNNNPMRYSERDISEQGALLGLSSEKIDVVQNINRSQAIELKKTLIGAVDEYLRWRNNESKEADYQKSSGAFTWLRHYTDFGKNRANAIIEIKRKIADNSDHNYNENAHNIIKAFESPSCCDFRKIRAALTTNPAIDEIMNPVRVGMQLN